MTPFVRKAEDHEIPQDSQDGVLVHLANPVNPVPFPENRP